MAAIDTFMAAIRQQESGGNYGAVNASSGDSGAYQFSLGTWQQALTLAGLANTTYYRQAAYLAPASVQDAAARALMTQYYQQFGQDWSNVAEAWYGGPGAVGHPNISGGPGYPTVGQYAAQVMAIFYGLGGTTPVPLSSGIPALQYPFTDQFAADVAFHYTNIVGPLWDSLNTYAVTLNSALVSPPGSLI